MHQCSWVRDPSTLLIVILKTFYLYMRVIQGVSWHIYTYIVLWVGSFHLLFSLFWLLSDFNVPYSYMYRKYICFILLYPLHLYCPSWYFFSLNIFCFTFLSFIVLVSVHCLVGFGLGILPVNYIVYNSTFWRSFKLQICLSFLKFNLIIKLFPS
jgi:hypothetical protein